jgi:hypothetical protein
MKPMHNKKRQEENSLLPFCRHMEKHNLILIDTDAYALATLPNK